MRRHLLIFGGDILPGVDRKDEDAKGFMSPDEESDHMVTRLGKQVQKTWKRWITVT